MKNFKEIVEKCLAGELSGIFVLRNGNKCLSSTFKRDQSLLTSFIYAEHFHYSDYGHCYSSTGHEAKFDIIDFIPDNITQEQVKINIPEGKVPVVEQTENGVVITWKEKELTYDDIESKLNCRISSCGFLPHAISIPFYKKVEVLRKLTNIRNYFGKPSKKNNDSGWVICINGTVYRAIVEQNSHVPVFAEKEHAEQAIKMLGDELKYLFEPW